MAENPSNDLIWILEIDQQHREFLAQIRHWNHLKMAADQGICWVKGLTVDQLEAPEIKSIPFKRIFYERGNRLYPFGSLLPVKRLPSSLLWMPLERGLPLTLPSFNHNYFGIDQRLTVRLIPSAAAQSSAAMLLSLETLRRYIESAPAVRLQPLSWVIIDDHALVLGTPLLPLPGDTWWEKGNSLLPSGYAWEWDILEPFVDEDLAGKDGHWLLWDKDGSYMIIPKAQCRALSLSSFRLTIASLTANHSLPNGL